MRINKYIGILLCILAYIACDNESLKDTYKEYAGKGEIRYLGRCKELSVTPGWKRIIVTWKNNIDPCIDKIKVKWELDEVKDSIILEHSTTEYNINTLTGNPLEDGNYEISVSSMDSSGATSIPSTTFGRPYTYTHEDIMTFNRVISRIFIIRNHLILSFLTWQDDLKEVLLDYTKKDGSSGHLVLNKNIVDKHYYLLPDEIDPSKPLVLYRKAELPNCKDVIDFEPYEFSTIKIFESDFKQELKRQKGFENNIPLEWMNNQEALFLDWSISSFIDLLNFPKLNKLILGSHRYLLDEAVSNVTYGQSKLTDLEASNFALQVLKNLNGLTIERYNKHFQGIDESLITEKGNSNHEPSVNFIDLSKAKITTSPKDDEDYNSHAENMIDGNFNTSWKPIFSTNFIIYEITIDLKSAQKINGIRLIQSPFKENPSEITIAPEIISVYVSNSEVNWILATYIEDYPLGKSQGEINYINFKNEITTSQYRYVQIRINSGQFSKFYCSSIAEINLY